MSTASKGARLERHVINSFVEKDPENREGIKSAASLTDIDIILIDSKNKKIIFGQCKNYKKELRERARNTIIAPIKKFEGIYTIEVKFFGKEQLRKNAECLG